MINNLLISFFYIDIALYFIILILYFVSKLNKSKLDKNDRFYYKYLKYFYNIILSSSIAIVIYVIFYFYSITIYSIIGTTPEKLMLSGKNLLLNRIIFFYQITIVYLLIMTLVNLFFQKYKEKTISFKDILILLFMNLIIISNGIAFGVMRFLYERHMYHI